MNGTNNFWQSEHIRLRPLREDDWQMYYEERDDTEGIRVLEAGIQLPITPEQTQAKYKELAERPMRIEGGLIIFTVETLDGQVAGGVNVHGYDSRNGTFSFAVRIYRPFRGRGFAKEALKILLRYGFYELRCQKANSATIEGNEASIRMHHALGFKDEGCIRRNAYTNGRYYDEVLFGMTREEFDQTEAA